MNSKRRKKKFSLMGAKILEKNNARPMEKITSRQMSVKPHKGTKTVIGFCFRL